MNWSQLVKAYLHYSRKERIAILTIVFFLACLWLLPRLLETNEGVSVEEGNLILTTVDSLNRAQTPKTLEEQNEIAYELEPSVSQSFSTSTLFKFDPNKLSAEGWKKLGLSDRSIKTIFNYLSKGGKFYKKEDLQKIWGLPDGFYSHVKDYIFIETHTSEKNYVGTVNLKPEKKIWHIEVNSADTAAFISLPGIGSKLASRIINFRDKLGGFYSVEQLRETYGISDSTFQKIKPFLYLNSNVKKIDINTISKNELQLHPYIKWNLANALVEYRNQHGLYKNIEELKNIAVIDDATFQKITPYLYVSNEKN